MLTEAERLKAEAQTREDHIKELERVVDIGKSAERLSIHPDWKRYCERIQVGITEKEGLSLEQFRSIFGKARTADEKAIAIDNARVLDCMVQQVRYIVDLVENEAKAGMEAKKELDDLRRSE